MRRYIPQKVNLSYLSKLCILAFSYFITAKIGLSLYAVHTFATLIWPSSGIALAVLVLWGYDLWPGILIAAFAVNLFTGASFFVALGIAIGNTLEAMVGTYLLRHLINLYRCFERLYDTLGFILLGVVTATFISASIGSLTLVAGHIIGWSDFFVTWGSWWIGNALGILVVTPFLLTWMAPTRPWNPDKLPIWEISSFFATLVVLNILIFWYPFGIVKNIPLLYLASLPLIWGVLRLGSRGMTVSLLITSVIATLSTVYGHGPFVIQPLSQGLLFCQVFIGTLSITFLIFLSIVKERKHAMEEIRDYVDKLRNSFQQVKSSDKAKTEFLAVLSHELRNPLASVFSSLELVTVSEPTGEIANIIDTAQTHVKHMSRLLDDLLDISSISKEKLILQKETVDMRSVINYSVEEATPLLKSKDHFLSVSLPKNPIFVYGDPVRLGQIVVNLLNNSAKYTDPHGSIALSLLAEGNTAVIRVHDNGIGIEPDMMEKIFEPFMQVPNNSTVKFSRGLGIGLSLSKKLVEAHDGNIAAQSKGLGKGSEFIVTMPVADAARISADILAGEKKKDIVRMEGNKKRQYRILVVDDNQAVADGLRKLLTHKGYEAHVAYSGQSALERMMDLNPHVVLLDIGLPDMDGYEVAQQIRQRFNPVTVLVALTGYGQDEDKLKAKEVGFNYHLTKPVSIIDIEAVLQEVESKK